MMMHYLVALNMGFEKRRNEGMQLLKKGKTQILEIAINHQMDIQF